MYSEFGISSNILDFVNKQEVELTSIFKNLDEIEAYNTLKVLMAFKNNNISESHFNQTTGYGYNDLGRDTIEKVYAEIFSAEDALVRAQLISGTHALAITLSALLRPNDIMLSITGKPYDTLEEVIGIVDNDSSLMSYGVKYEEIDLVDNDFDYNKIEKALKEKKIKLIEIQRSKGYSTRKSIDMDSLEKVIKFIKSIDKDVIIMIDNCYCEFVTKKEPTEVGADIVVGSLIKNLGGGIATSGAYIVGAKSLIKLCAERLNVPGQGKEVGPSLGMNRQILQGLFMAPSVVNSSLKIAILTSKCLEELGYEVEPKYNDRRADIVENISFKDEQKLIAFCQAIQAASPVDAMAVPEAGDMPGYPDKVIMAAGTFTQGSSIELSCDGPIRYPYIAYMQGGLTYASGKLAVMSAINKIEKL